VKYTHPIAGALEEDGTVLASVRRRSDIADIYDKVLAGERLVPADGLRLLASRDLATLGAMANAVRERLNSSRTYYVINRHINYSNICVNACRFCAFSRRKDERDAYAMTLGEIFRLAREALTEPVTEFHIVGGLHPELPFEFYEAMLRGLRAIAPGVHLQAFTAVEIAHIAAIAGLGVRETLERLREAGLGSLPGGGAEVFAPKLRQELCPTKLSGDGWLDVMRTAHTLGIQSNATMLYGHVETDAQLVEHLDRIRALQDETGGFMAFIPLAFHPANTALEASRPSSDLRSSSAARPSSGGRDLQIMAVARVYLDNVPHLKAFWIMLGVKLAQVALSFGADDLDGTVVEERITHAAGASTPQALAVDALRALIEEAGRTPVERTTLYDVVERRR
jgi:aminodeoxyfutalosine synthase